MRDKKRYIKGIFYSGFFLITVFAVSSCEEKNPYIQGKILYENFCANCHMEDGTGLVEVIPPLAGSDYLVKFPEKLPCMIRKGISGEMTVNGKIYNTEMPGDRKSVV